MSDDDIPQLSADTLAALLAFQTEQQEKEEALKNGKCETVDEDWQMSQFWYDEATARTLVKECVTAAKKRTIRPAHIACVSSPTLMRFFHETEEYKNGEIAVTLFEFDTRFHSMYPQEFVHFDYNRPTEISEDFRDKFDIIIADPPFLAAECLIKTAHAMRLIGKADVQMILCTGAVMEDLAARLLDMHLTSFEPKHHNNLANDFRCYANYKTSTFP